MNTNISIQWLANVTGISRATFYNRGFDRLTTPERLAALGQMADEYEESANVLSQKAARLRQTMTVANSIVELAGK